MPNNNKPTYINTAKPTTRLVSDKRNLLTNPQCLMQPLLNLYIKISKEDVSGKLKLLQKLLIGILFITLPWNLGKHFELESSWVTGSLVPYLIPTVYLQDLLIASIAVTGSFVPFGSRSTRTYFATRVFFLFLLTCFFSLFFTPRTQPSIYFFARLLLYYMFFLTALPLVADRSVRRLFFLSVVVNIVLLSFLSIVQFAKQTSVFSNYLFFGEQPYNVYTPFIAKESFSGVAKIPPYGTFTHPNTLAGFLVVFLTMLVGVFGNRIQKFRFGILVTLVSALVLGFITVFLTKSYLAWVALAFGITLLIFVYRIRVKFVTWLFVSLCALILFASTLFPLYKKLALDFLPKDSITSTLSVERRSALLLASYNMIVRKPLFGWGLNSYTYNFESFYHRFEVTRFIQPVHNVLVLIAVETGIFGAALFFAVIIFTVLHSVRVGNVLYSVVLTQILILLCFDHYFFTIHQTYLLFILTLMLALTYTRDTDCL